MPARTITISADLAGQTLAAALRRLVPELSWSAAKRLIVTRRVLVNGTLCLNDARRLGDGDVLTIHEQSLAPVKREHDIRILHIDPDLIVIDKPAGVVTLRRDEESGFSDERKELQPTLDELIPILVPGAKRHAKKGRQRRTIRKEVPIYAVHRLDRDTSGLMIFALSVRARDALIRMFSRHQVRRTYIAVVRGRIDAPRTIESWLVRDRGDGLRGSSPRGKDDPDTKPAITHIRPIEHIRDQYTMIECALETGRTHQIRIHLAEIGHMLCGEKLYTRPRAGAEPIIDESAAPRQALHSASLRFTHPISGKELSFDSPLPKDVSEWLSRLRELTHDGGSEAPRQNDE